MVSRCTIGAIASKNASAFSSGQFADGVRQRRGGERAGGDDGIVPVRRRKAGDFAALDLDQRMVLQCLGDGRGEPVAVNGQRAAGGHLVGVGGAHDQRAQPAHLRMQQANSVVRGVVGAKRVGADQFGQASVWCASVMRSGRISCRMTRTPVLATCQAASEPARPPPMIWTVSVWGVEEIMRAGLARFQLQCTCRSVFERSMAST